MTPQLESALVQVANKISSSADTLHTVLVNQAFIDGLYWIIFTIAYVFAFVFWAKFVLKKTTPDKDGDSEWYNEGKALSWISLFVSGIIGIFVVALNLYNFLVALFNPDYWALQQLLYLLKNSS